QRWHSRHESADTWHSRPESAKTDPGTTRQGCATRTPFAAPRVQKGGDAHMSSPFDVLTSLDRLASSMFDMARSPRLMPVDLFRDGDQYVLSADLPGIDPQSVDLDVDGQLLTIRAERPAPADTDVKWIVRERPYGTYMRQFTLGDGVDVDKITA